jgi:hypothetical protein
MILRVRGPKPKKRIMVISGKVVQISNPWFSYYVKINASK